MPKVPSSAAHAALASANCMPDGDVTIGSLMGGCEVRYAGCRAKTRPYSLLPTVAAHQLTSSAHDLVISIGAA